MLLKRQREEKALQMHLSGHIPSLKQAEHSSQEDRKTTNSKQTNKQKKLKGRKYREKTRFFF